MTKNADTVSEVGTDAIHVPEVREGPASDTIEGIENKGSTLPEFSLTRIQTLQNSRTTLEDDVISQVFTRLDQITNTLNESHKKLEDSNKQVQILTRRASDLEAAIEEWNTDDRGEENQGAAPVEEREEYANFHQELSEELAAQVQADVEGHRSLNNNLSDVEADPFLERRISPGESQGRPTATLTGASYPLGTTGDNYNVPLVVNVIPPPGLMPLQETRHGGVLPQAVGLEDNRATGIMNSSVRDFDDVTSFFSGGGQPINRSDQPAQRGYVTPSTDMAGRVPMSHF